MDRMTDHIIFATNFSDACHAVIPTLTRWVDAHRARLTLLHVYRPDKTRKRDAESLLHSFYAEADNYPNCKRHLIEGDPCKEIARFCHNEDHGLLFMPPSDRTGLPRPLHTSTRARMIQTLDLPVWTMGQATLNTGASVAGSNIAVWVQDLHRRAGYVQAAAAHAQRHNSTLHLLHVVPDPDEGTLVSSMYSRAPLGEETALNELNLLAHGLPSGLKVQVQVGVGTPHREIKRLLHKCGAELMVVGQNDMVRQGWFGPEMNPILNSCTIPLICVPEHFRLERDRAAASLLAAA